MNSTTRFVFDTNTLISHLLLPTGVPAQAVKKGLMEDQLLVSEATLNELADVLSRSKFDPYISLEDRQDFFKYFGKIAETIPVIKTIQACNDPKDDKFLELAINGKASTIITGDKDLLIMNPFQNMQIITPAQFILVE